MAWIDWRRTAALWESVGLRTVRRGILQHHRIASYSRRWRVHCDNGRHLGLQTRPLRQYGPRDLGTLLALRGPSLDVRSAICVPAECKALKLPSRRSLLRLACGGSASEG